MNLEKFPISEYPKDTAPVVLLWNDEWANPLIGALHYSKSKEYPAYACCNRGRFFSAPIMPNPTHFSCLQEEG